MKLLGHGYIAVNSVPSGNQKLLILGSVVPEIMFYTKGHPFTFEEIHEGGDLVYRYLRRQRPDLTDFGLGMISHGVKYGADKFNFDESLILLGYGGGKVEELRKEIAAVLGISNETAKVRMHNVLELAVEVGLITREPNFVSVFVEAISDSGSRKEVSAILAACFKKAPEAVSVSVEELFAKAKPEYFTGAAGLARLWAALSKDFDPAPNIGKLSHLLDKLATGFKGRDQKFLTECLSWTSHNLEGISRHPERI